VYSRLGREHRLENADYFRQKAAQCRRLAESLVNQDDPAVGKLLALAVEFEAKAVALTAEAATAAQINPPSAPEASAEESGESSSRH
jgi:hypothetical protein